MFALHLALQFTLCALLATPTFAAAWIESGHSPVVTFAHDILTVDLPCPTPDRLSATIDGGPLQPVTAAPAPAQPTAVALVVESSPMMGATGTPHSIRLADATILATALLDRLPAGSLITLITFDTSAITTLPLTADQTAARLALAALAVHSELVPPAPTALAEALMLAEQALDAAPSSHRASVVFTASAPDADKLRPLYIGQDTPLTVVELAPGAGGPAAGQTTVVPFYTDDSALLPALLATFDQHIATLLSGGLARISLPTRGLAPGSHLLSITGCGAPVTLAFDVPARLALPAALGGPSAAFVACVVVYGFWQRRRCRGERATAQTSTTRYSLPARVTTARRNGTHVDRCSLVAVVWEGQERLVFPINGRQLTVGRDAGCDIRLASAWVSALHARISFVGAGAEITDLGSTNGTFIGDLSLQLAPDAPTPLTPGDTILIGPEVYLRLEPADDADDGGRL